MIQKCKSILIVEDDADIRECLEEALSSEGYQVSTASNGREALSFMSSKDSPGLILLDLAMPVMDGKTFIEQVNRGQNSIKPETHILVLSASSEIQGFEKIAAEVIKKPVDLTTLFSAVQKHCGHPK